jgi:arylsulfatase A-like enzyme
VVAARGVATVPEIFPSAGYYTFNEGKNHYDFVDRDRMLFDRHGDTGFDGSGEDAPWAEREADQPFFGQIQLRGGKEEVSVDIDRVDPDSVAVPPYYPDHPVYREEIAHHYDTI